MKAVFGLASLALFGAVGCDVLHTMHSDHTGQRTAPSAPISTFSPLAWIESPTAAQLTAFLCPQLGQESPLGSEASAACRAQGPTPVPSSLHFQVRADATVGHRGMLRLSLESMLLVVTAYPDAGASQALGAVCLTFCDEGASTCPQTDEACRSSADGVVELGHLDGAGGMITANAVTENRVADLEVRSLPPHGETPLTVDLTIATDRLLAAIRANDTAAIEAIRAGQPGTYAIPYAIEGTIWVEGRGNDGFAEPMTRATGTLEITP